MKYASLWRRLGAAVIDMISLTIIIFIVFLCFLFLVGCGYWFRGSSINNDGNIDSLMIVYSWLIITTIISWLYYAILESSEVQATLGKKALKIKVTDTEGNPIDFKRASLRYLGRCISHTTLGILYIIIAFTRKRQGVHDLLADTVVLKEDEKVGEK